MDQAGELAARLGLPGMDLALLERALVHGSFTNEHPDAPGGSNERLEFLGDAVVALVISEALYERHPDEDEGALTARRASLVSTRALARVSQRLRLDEAIVLGQGAERTGERRRASVLAAVFEAVAAAVYLDRGFAATRAWLTTLLARELDEVIPVSSLKSPKSRLQELGYVRWGSPPTYRLVSAAGPDHAKHYVVDVVVGDQTLGRGEGANRRDAETEAAARAIEILESRATEILEPRAIDVPESRQVEAPVSGSRAHAREPAGAPRAGGVADHGEPSAEPRS